MLNLVLITYNDMPLIKACVESVIDQVDRIVAVDGIFDTFPHGEPEPGYSTDGTLEYLTGLDKEVVLTVAPDLSEVEKRNLYLIGNVKDWYLHLDTDEWVVNPEALADLPDTDICFCPMSRENSFHWYPRLFRHIEGLHYEGLHYRLVDGEGKLYCDIQGAGDYRSQKYGLKIRHDRDSRSPERQKRKARYYKHLTAHERPIKELLRYGN